MFVLMHLFIKRKLWGTTFLHWIHRQENECDEPLMLYNIVGSCLFYKVRLMYTKVFLYPGWWDYIDLVLEVLQEGSAPSNSMNLFSIY